MKLLMVCIGNICRSPLAEGIMKEKLKNAGLDFFVDSAGMISYHTGEPPDSRSIEIAKQNGIDISNQLARQITKNDFEKFDLIFAMESSVYDELIFLAPSAKQKIKVHLFLDFAEWKFFSDVPDPYYGTKKDFEEVFQLINDVSEKIITKFLSSKKN
ncbi:MAG: low molecular weight protein-tyrosine-phosphatase [Bacteroidota bacterium]